MVYFLSLILTNLFCSLTNCNVQTDASNGKIIKALPRKFERSLDISGNEDTPLVITKLGAVEGFKMKINREKEIFAFTGVPYGEPPVGNLRFRSPVPRKPWKGIWKATSPSPLCPQMDTLALARQMSKEDCLYLDIYTPRIPTYKKGTGKTQGLPVLIWIFGGANIFGKTHMYGPNYFLREDVILVVPNIRLGVLGFLSTGDEASPGNWALKDQSLAVKFVYDNIKQFGGDPNKISIGGISSGAYTAQAMLYTKHKTRDYIKGVISISGTVLANTGLDATGTVQKTSDAIAKAAGCPTSAEGLSFRMVECLREKNPLFLSAIQLPILTKFPPMEFSLCPIIEPNVTGAFITELPENLYEKGEVPAIPIVVSRAEEEYSLWFRVYRYNLLQLLALKWDNWIREFLKLGYRSYYGVSAQSNDEVMNSVKRINQLYFNKTTAPDVANREEFLAMIQMADDTMVNAPMWKLIEYHHKLAPTYVYINKHNTFFQIHPLMNFVDSVFLNKLQSSHAVDYILLFSYRNIPKHIPGSNLDIVSRNLINLLANFADFGKPLYRTPKGELLSLWRPVEDMNRPYVLEVGLRHNISMIRDPLVGTERLKIWETVRFS